MPKITKRVVDATKPGATDVFVWDTEIVGFGLKVFCNGAKSYIFQYRNPQGISRRGTLGKSSDTFTAEQARTKAKKWRRAIEDGGDPLAEKRAQHEALTVSDVLDAYLQSEKFAEKAGSTRAIDDGRIKRHLRPTLGKKIFQYVTAEDVRRALGQIRDGKTAATIKTGPRGLARVTGGDGAARMAIRLYKAVESWATDEGYKTSKPAAAVKVGSDGERDTILESTDDYARLFRALEEFENQKQIKRAHADAIRIIALTGARRGEIAGLRWRHVDLPAGVITLPRGEHKTGKKTKKPRVIGLPAAAQAVIARQPDGEPEDFVFSASKGEGAITLSNVWRKVREKAELPEGMGLHGLRHSLASHMAMDGAQAAEIMTTLGHRQLSTAQKYIHWVQDARVALAEKSAAHISDAMNPKKQTAEVSPLPAKAGRRA